METPTHALFAAAREPVRLYRAEGAADWTAISEIIGKTLPGLIGEAETGDVHMVTPDQQDGLALQ